MKQIEDTNEIVLNNTYRPPDRPSGRSNRFVFDCADLLMLEMFSSFVKVETALDIDSERRLFAHFLLPFHFCLRYIGKYHTEE